MSLRSCPPFPTMAPGLMASMVTTPVSKSKNRSVISASSGTLARIFSSTRSDSDRDSGSGRMSTLFLSSVARVLVMAAFSENLSKSLVYITTVGPSKAMDEMSRSEGTMRRTSSRRLLNSLSVFMTNQL